jgi:hypothetical protein
MKKYKIWAEEVPEIEITVSSEEQAIAWFAALTALTNHRMGLHCEDAYMDYHNRNEEDRNDSFEDWVAGADRIYCEIIEEEVE